MSYLAALVLLGIAAQAPQQPDAVPAGSFMLFGKPVHPAAPAVGAAGYPADVQAWHGWGPLTGAPPRPFGVDGDWAPILAAAPAARPGASAPWRVKVLLVSSVDFLSPDAAGNLVERRSGIYGPTRDRLAAGLALAATTLQAQTAGRLQVSFDCTEDPALFEETCPEGAGFGPRALQAYVEPRINGGAFEANDKLYHGPYHVCLVVHAGLGAPAQCEASGTPVFGIPAPRDDANVSAYAAAALRAFQSAARFWSARHGRLSPSSNDGGPADNAFGDQPADQIAEDADFGPVSGADLVAASKAAPIYGPKPYPGAPVLSRAAVSTNAALSIVQDPAMGPVLTAKLGGVFPDGGFGVPLPMPLSQLAASSNHFLVFEARTASPDALGLGVTDGEGPGPGISLGRPPSQAAAVDLPTDGAWHKVAIDLRGLDRTAGEDLYIGFLKGALAYPKASIQATEYSFADFSLAAEAPGDALAVNPAAAPAWEARASAARAAASGGTPALVQALDDPEPTVKLNALTVLASAKAPALEQKIALCMGTIDPRVGEAALAALANQDTPEAWATLQVALRVGPGTHTKVVAAGFIAQRKNAASAGQIGALEGSARDWHDRVALANALAECGTPQAVIFLREFLDDPDPGVRVVAAGLIPVDDPDGLRKLMFVGVNDPSDAARAAACIRLLQSASPDPKKEGYRGANDDSWRVRVMVLDWIAAHPSADDRPALRQALSSPYGPVRAAALHALATSIGPVSVDEVAGILRDEDPAVQRALLGLAAAKSLGLPAESLAVLRASIAPDVAAAAKSLPGS